MSWGGQSCAADCTFKPECFGLASRGHTRRFIRYWKLKVEIRADGIVCDVDRHSEEDGGLDLVSKEQDGARGYSARQDRLYLVGFLSFLLNFSDD